MGIASTHGRVKYRAGKDTWKWRKQLERQTINMDIKYQVGGRRRRGPDSKVLPYRETVGDSHQEKEAITSKQEGL